jgi:hypothetical protein
VPLQISLTDLHQRRNVTEQRAAPATTPDCARARCA